MTPTEFAALVRAGNEKLRVDNVVVNAGGVKLHGRGVLRIGPEELEIDLTLSGRQAPPEARQIITRKDAWRLSGLIDNHLRFRCDNVSPGGKGRWRNGIVTITRTLHSIELVSGRAKRTIKALLKRSE